MAEAVAAFVVRLGLVLLFLPFSALDKLLNFDGAGLQLVRAAKRRHPTVDRPHNLTRPHAGIGYLSPWQRPNHLLGNDT